MKKAIWPGLVLILIVLAGAVAPAEKPLADANRALAKEQLKLARRALGDLDQLFKGGEVSIDDPRFIVWQRRQVEALRASGAPKAEIVAALEVYLKRMKDLEQVARRRLEQAVVDRVSVHEAAYRVLEAEMWLSQEKAR
jgi:hypothetical protein